MAKKVFIDVVAGKAELIEMIKSSKTALRPDFESTDKVEEADAILTDLPSKYYGGGRKKGQTLFATRRHMMCFAGEGWGWIEVPDAGIED